MLNQFPKILCTNLPVKAILGEEAELKAHLPELKAHLNLQGIEYAISVVVHLPEDQVAEPSKEVVEEPVQAWRSLDKVIVTLFFCLAIH